MNTENGREFVDTSMLVYAHDAGSLGCSVIWSEDFSHGQTIDQVTVCNPFR